MTNKFLYVFLLCSSILFYNCNTKGSDQQAELDPKQIIEKAEPTIINVSSKTIHPSIIDTTSYLADCFYENLTHKKQSFIAMENILIEQNILKNETQKGYQDFFIKYVQSSKLGLYNTAPIHKGSKKYFENKLKIANTLKAHIKSAEKFKDRLNQCYKIQSKKVGFEKSQINILIDKINKFYKLAESGELDKKYPNNTLLYVLNKEFPSALFNHIDTRLIQYLMLYSYLQKYDEEQMNLEYQNALEMVVLFKKDSIKEKTTNNSSMDKSPVSDPNHIEIIEMTDKEVEDFTKNGGIIKSTEPDE
ncbi:hypothetical protein GCM10022393_32230 [Aquimarina addita]|uniref:Uncharacterized protein n=1 Tax=Aquimarina addita TaxID=870485 RepID=A0ABP6URN5_9FLAO